VKKGKHLLLILFLLAMSGCAHKIEISPDLSIIESKENSDKISASIGYYIDPVSKEREVITPGGGGDRIRYKPYFDIEDAFSAMLHNIFTNVITLDSIANNNSVNKSIDYLLTLDITTNSSSASMLTWPPTWFGVNISSNLMRPSGEIIETLSVKGEGRAEYSEFLFNKGLAGRRASLDAINKMQNALLSVPQLNGKNINIINQSDDDASRRIKKLKELYDSGLITDSEYNSKRNEILDSL
jgi:hypothetical protein